MRKVKIIGQLIIFNCCSNNEVNDITRNQTSISEKPKTGLNEHVKLEVDTIHYDSDGSDSEKVHLRLYNNGLFDFSIEVYPETKLIS